MSYGRRWWEEEGMDISAGDQVCLGNSVAAGVVERRCRKQGDSSPTSSVDWIAGG